MMSKVFFDTTCNKTARLGLLFTGLLTLATEYTDFLTEKRS